jgi:hypothetical protein
MPDARTPYMDHASDSHPSEHRTDVAFFLPDLGGGGTQKLTVILANGLAARGYAVEVLLVKAEGVHRPRLKQNVRVTAFGAANSYLALPGLAAYLRRKRPVVLVSALDLTNLIAIIARWLSATRPALAIRIENMLSIQRRSWWKKPLEQMLLSWLYLRGRQCHCCPKAVAQTPPAASCRSLYS